MERTWLQLMCCALSIGRSLYFRVLGRVELRRSPGRVDNIDRDQDQRFEVRDGGGVRDGVGVREVAKRSRELDQVVDSIFKLKTIHAGEVAYKRSRTIGG
jgi:hypothetical protein